MRPEDRAGAEAFFDRIGVGAQDTATLDELRGLPGDQEPPTHRSGVPGSHDLVVGDLSAVERLASGRPLTQAMRSATQLVILARRDAGLASYGTVLQPDNGRSVDRDALEEAADLVAYLRNGLREGKPWHRIYDAATEVLVDLTAQTGGAPCLS